MELLFIIFSHLYPQSCAISSRQLSCGVNFATCVQCLPMSSSAPIGGGVSSVVLHGKSANAVEDYLQTFFSSHHWKPAVSLVLLLPRGQRLTPATIAYLQQLREAGRCFAARQVCR